MEVSQITSSRVKHTILSGQDCRIAFTVLAFHVVLKLLNLSAIHCGQELID
jgi:hypothetical protein